MWPPLSMAVLIVCSLICGCSGSTSGGIKIDRAILKASSVLEMLVGRLEIFPILYLFQSVRNR